jgi:hypothetical protein
LGNKQQILSLLSTNIDGQRIVQYLDVKRFTWPGRLDNPEVNNVNHKYWLELSNICDTDPDHPVIKNGKLASGQVIYKASRRTNVI